MNFNPARIRTLSFWHYQCAGWAFVAVAQLLRIYAVGKLDWYIGISLTMQTVAGLLVTSMLRLWYRNARYQTYSLAAIIGLIVVGATAVTIVWWGVFLFIQYSLFGPDALSEALIPLTIVTVHAYTFPKHLTWCTLYFGIKVWQDWVKECEQILQAEAAAQRAQFHTLRYKLNPDFFFSTLKMIHDLMEINASSSKALVTSLAECLRYSLVTKSGVLIPMKTELDAVRQYLSIEQELAGELLHIVYDIDRESEGKLVPAYSMLSLVEYLLRSSVRAGGLKQTIELRCRFAYSELEIALELRYRCTHREFEKIPVRSGDGERAYESNETLREVEARLKESFPGKCRMEVVRNSNENSVSIHLWFTTGDAHDKKNSYDNR